MVKRKSIKKKTLKGRGNGALGRMYDDPDDTLTDYDRVCRRNIIDNLLEQYDLTIQHNHNMTDNQYYNMFLHHMDHDTCIGFINYFEQSLLSLYHLCNSQQAIANHMINYYHQFSVNHNTAFRRMRYLVNLFKHVSLPLN